MIIFKSLEAIFLKDITTISDIMQKNIICFTKNTLMSEIVKNMQDKEISSILICENKKTIGIITERDILKESLTPELSISKQAHEVMSSSPFCVQERLDYREAYILMTENNIRHLIVETDEGHVVGIVSESDFLNHLSPEQLLAVKNVEKIMIKNVITCSPTDLVHICLKTMSENRISTLVIKEGKRAVGIISERDTLAFIQNNNNILNKPISYVMNAPLVSIHYKESVLKSQEIMRLSNIRRLVVIDDDGDMLGLVTRHDLVKNVPNNYIQVLKGIVEHQQSVLDEKLIYQNTLNSMPHALILATDTLGNIQFIKFNAEELSEEIHIEKYTHISELSDPLFALLKEKKFKDILLKESIENKVIKRASTHNQYFETSISKILNNSGSFEGYLYIAKDITSEFNIQKKIRQSAKVFQNTTEGVMITDEQGYIVDTNEAFSTITGYLQSESLNQKASLLRSGRHTKAFYEELWSSIESSGNWQGEIYNRRKDGQIYPQWLNISSIHSPEGELENYVAVFSDITQLKESEEKLNLAIHYDHLTKLPNKTLLKARLEHTLSVSKRHSTFVAVMFINLDNFKKINDSFGHSFGDEVLVGISKRIFSILREDDTLAHIGGDEFVIVMNNFESIDNINHIAQKIIKTFQSSYSIVDQEVWVTASMGISISPNDGYTSEVLLKNADIAMYEAKSDGKNSFKYYNSKMTANAFERIIFENALKIAVENGEFEVHYQPQQDLQGDEIVGFEALVRWNHPTLGKIPPDKFIPIAEETKLIIDIGEFVLKQVCIDLKLWKEAGLYRKRVSINLSGVQIEHSDFIATLKNSIKEYNIAPHMLEIEITESIVMSNPAHWIDSLMQIRELGIPLSVDDFGTGYSSLSYLRSLPINTLKIDMSFVRDLPSQKDACAIANAIISLGTSLGLTVIAEGVEDEEQKEYLKSVGCHQIQGFLLARPMSKVDVDKWLVQL